LCAAFKGSIAAIKATDIDEYLKSYPGAKTKKNHRVSICSVFAYAQRKGILPVGLTEAQKSERPTTSIVEPCVVSSQDLTKLLSECTNKRLAAYMAIAAFAGVRSAEIQRLRWRDIREEVDDAGFGAIVLGPKITKTNRRRIAEVSPNLRAWIDKLRGEPDEFVTYPEEEFYSLYEHLSKLCKKLGVTKEQNAFRHTFVSCHIELHRDGPRTAKTAGHSLTMLETNYLKLVSRNEADAWFKIFPPETKTYAPVVLKPKRSNRRIKDLIAERNTSYQQQQKRK
jgi:integrase